MNKCIRDNYVYHTAANTQISLKIVENRVPLRLVTRIDIKTNRIKWRWKEERIGRIKPAERNYYDAYKENWTLEYQNSRNECWNETHCWITDMHHPGLLY